MIVNSKYTHLLSIFEIEDIYNKWSFDIDINKFIETISNDTYNITTTFKKRGTYISSMYRKLWPNKHLYGNIKIDTYILREYGLKYCPKCKEVLELDAYYLSKHTIGGYECYCKTCLNTKGREYRASNLEKSRETSRNNYYTHRSEYAARNIAYKDRVRQSIPSWSQKDLIKEFYSNCPEGYHVDHIVPLKGTNVSGLHVIENLQYLLARDNIAKGNTYNNNKGLHE